MPHLSIFNKRNDFENSSAAMAWFLSGVAVTLFMMLLGLIFMG